jgi:hypothetical protein
MSLFYGWCKRKYRFKYIEEIPTPTIPKALSVGRIVHDYIDKFWDNYELNLDSYVQDINDYQDKVVKELAKRDIDDPDYYTKTLPRIYSDFSNFLLFQIRRIKNYQVLYGDDAISEIRKHFFPILSESYGKVKINDRVNFAFVVDALFYNEDGNILIDWKTSKTCNEKKFESHKPQLKRYAMCLSSLNKTCDKMGIFYTKDGLFFSEDCPTNYSLAEEVLQFVRDLQVSKFPEVPKNEHWKCSNSKWDCEYYDICGGPK